MSLTTLLALLAGLVLLLILAHGAWVTYRAKPRPVRGKTTADTSAVAGSRQEPTLGQEAADTVPMDMPSFGSDSVFSALNRAPMKVRRSTRIDALIDAIATVTPEHFVTGEMALLHLPASRRAGGKPMHVEGLNALTGEWELPQPGQRYGEFQAGVQLANRSGALNEIEYSEFVQKVQHLADSLGAVVDFPDMLDVVARARELDAFASMHDAQLGAMLRANSVTWAVNLVHQAASRHGFVTGPVAGSLVLPAAEEGAPPVLVLSYDAHAAMMDDPSRAALGEISISLDVPQTPESTEPFTAWQDCVRRLADDLDATLVDDRGALITLHAFSSIGQELSRLYQVLEDRGLTAGSPAARRLFS